MARKQGRTETRKVKHGPNKGKRTTLITIRDSKGNITHSYRPKDKRSDQ